MSANNSKNLYLDDVGDITLKAHGIIEEELKKFNIVLSDEESDKIWDSIWTKIEELSNGNYRREL